jgi:hypothetical protein
MSRKKPAATFTRRAFLTQSGGVLGAAVLAPTLSPGCGGDDDDDSPNTAGTTTGDTATDSTTESTETGDTGGMGETTDASGTDAPDPDTDTDTGTGNDPSDTTPPSNDSPVIEKGPWVQVIGAAAVRIRFETEGAAASDARLTRGGRTERVVPVVTAAPTNYQWPKAASLIAQCKHPDRAGAFSLQDIIVENLVAGETIAWSIGSPTGPASGEFRVRGGAESAPWSFVWLADTMTPKVTDVGALVASLAPNLVLHGGDIQYMDNPLDTWSGAFAAFHGFSGRGPLHFVVGNHEYDTEGEFSATFARLLTGQGESQGPEQAHAFRWGPCRFIVLNTEAPLAAADSPQQVWLKATLASLTPGEIPVVAFHRPYFTLSEEYPLLDVRDALHPLLVAAGVKLVLTGHNHCYERFAADGITYIVEGGGGGSRSPTDAGKDWVAERRPGDAALRKFAVSSFGCVRVQVAADGGLSGERFELGGQTVDRFTL